jgi:L-alanine-DL-glutamate epimerase-like enolase superfamily enzyme
VAALKIDRARAGVVRVPLVRPYALSFVTLESFAVRLVEITTDAGVGLGEAVALPGYGEETDDDVAASLARVVPRLAGVDCDEALEVAARELVDAPFARAAVMSAIEDASSSISGAAIEWPQVGILSAGDPAACVRRAREIAAEGFGTIKVKIGREVESDIASARALLEAVPGVLFRFDANQAYTEAQAARFMASIEGHAGVELVEQPLGIDEWEASRRLAASSSVPLMLDEAIFDGRDIDRAAEVGAALIKLKLCKVRGRADLLALARRARAHGLGVVLGNGVAGDVGNAQEALAWAAEPGLWAGAGEANGFAKLKSPVLADPPALRGGALFWTPGRMRASAEVEWVAGSGGVGPR